MLFRSNLKLPFEPVISAEAPKPVSVRVIFGSLEVLRCKTEEGELVPIPNRSALASQKNLAVVPVSS